MVCWADGNERADTCLRETRVSVKVIMRDRTSVGGGEDGAEVMGEALGRAKLLGNR